MKMIMLACLSSVLAKQEKYIILHHRHIDPFINFDNQSFALAAPETIFFNNIEPYDITTAFVDKSNINYISDGELIENDPAINLPQYSNDLSYTSWVNDLILQNVPICNEIPTSNVKIIIVDSLFIKPKFLNANVEVLANFVEPYECNSHGANVASVISMINIANRMNFSNIAVFPCTGTTTGSIIISALNVLMSEAKNSPDKIHIVNFSGEGEVSRVIDYAFIMASKLPNVRIHVAAGNSAQNCMLTSPARISAISNIRSVGSACQTIPCDFTNYEDSNARLNEQCISINLPSCFYVTSAYFGKPQRLCGTSFSTPIDTALDVIATFKNPNLNTENIFSMLNEANIEAQVPNNSNFTGVWQVLDKTMSCPVQVSDREIFDTNIVASWKKTKLWYDATSNISNSSRFCVDFSLPEMNSLVIKARRFEAQNQYLNLRIYLKKTSYSKVNVRAMVFENQNLIYKGTTKKIVAVNKARFRIEMYDDDKSLGFFVIGSNQAQKSLIFSTNVNVGYKQIAFASIKKGRKIVIHNAQRCYYRL